MYHRPPFLSSSQCHPPTLHGRRAVGRCSNWSTSKHPEIMAMPAISYAPLCEFTESLWKLPSGKDNIQQSMPFHEKFTLYWPSILTVLEYCQTVLASETIWKLYHDVPRCTFKPCRTSSSAKMSLLQWLEKSPHPEHHTEHTITEPEHIILPAFFVGWAKQNRRGGNIAGPWLDQNSIYNSRQQITKFRMWSTPHCVFASCQWPASKTCTVALSCSLDEG